MHFKYINRLNLKYISLYSKKNKIFNSSKGKDNIIKNGINAIIESFHGRINKERTLTLKIRILGEWIKKIKKKKFKKIRIIIY